MMPQWPRAWGDPPGGAVIRSCPEDFQVTEELGFELAGAGEHRFLCLRKRQLTSMELVQRVSALSKVPQRDIGLCGLKDRNALTQQWLSVRMAGRAEPDWLALEAGGDIAVVAVGWHPRKLRRGVHRANRFALVLRGLQVASDAGSAAALFAHRLQQLRAAGVPNYFGEQRFGRGGATLAQALRWMRGGPRSRKITREKRSLYFSALRAYVFNCLLAQRVRAGTWDTVLPDDVCMLHGTRSFFRCETVTPEILQRARTGDLHAGLPLWGRGRTPRDTLPGALPAEEAAECLAVCDFLEAAELDLSWRATRLLPDDFCWQFCDDGTLLLEFSLGAGAYATALLAEFVRYQEGCRESGISG